MKKCLFFLFNCLLISTVIPAQRSVVDSLLKLLPSAKTDTARLKLLNQVASACAIYNPDSALLLSTEVLSHSRQLNFTEGEKRALKTLANTFIKLGNYPRALEMHLQSLKIAEKENNTRGIATAYINIGSVYVYQEQYRDGLPYYLNADSLIEKYQLEDLKYFTALNIGDLYDRLNITDSSYAYFKKSLEIAGNMNEGDFIGTSKIGLGHSFRKMGKYTEALDSYLGAMPYLKEANDEDMICEATLGLAKLYDLQNKNDSAGYYANQSYEMARKDGFQSRELDAAVFLTDHYRKVNNIDSAFAYINHVQALKDSIDSKERIRALQVMSTNEQLRQIEMEAAKKRAIKERGQQLQLLFIGIFIPGLFLITLLLSRIKIPVRAIRLMGILSLLILFEYLTLLLHPRVVEFTNHTPIYEIMIFVAIAAILIPLHHRVEHWLIEKLIHKRNDFTSSFFKLRIMKIKMKKPSE